MNKKEEIEQVKDKKVKINEGTVDERTGIQKKDRSYMSDNRKAEFFRTILSKYKIDPLLDNWGQHKSAK
jgi:hypothetical protein